MFLDINWPFLHPAQGPVGPDLGYRISNWNVIPELPNLRSTDGKKLGMLAALCQRQPFTEMAGGPRCQSEASVHCCRSSLKIMPELQQ